MIRSTIAKLIARELRSGNRLKDEPCWRCQGHGCITIYSSYEYAAPCPACRGANSYHRVIDSHEGGIPAELKWNAETEAADRVRFQ